MKLSWQDLRLNFFFHASLILLCSMLGSTLCVAAEKKKPTPRPATDVLVLSNGDTLHGNLVKVVSGKVTFHTETLGDLDVSWDHIKELHAPEKFGVLEKNLKLRGKNAGSQIPVGTVDVADQAITVHGENAPAAPVAVKNAEYVVDAATLDKQMHHEPGFLTGWNGAATAGATVVKATQDQYTFSGALGLSRSVPTVSWLRPRNRTLADFTGSYGKITQPGYVAGGVAVAPTVSKSAIYHLDGERDQYISAKIFALVQTAFDHNFAQDLQLQQIYGGGLGWTLFSTPRHQADLKATIQYEKQKFISGTSGASQNLIGSTFSATYLLHIKPLIFTQGLAYIPAYNTPRAYSANETDTLAFPAFKNLGFSVGTIDSYLNDSPTTVPPTKRNSFQFTMGLTYAFQSKY